jgi:hypothetical protein
MGKLSVESIRIAELLEALRSNAWMVPSFQRDFVWSEAEVTSLALSVIEARPIGMATLWEQADDSDLALEPASIPDTHESASVEVSLSSDVNHPKKFFAILDGRQRATALAMAFGGLRASDARRRFSGQYFLDVTQADPSERVRYLKDAQIKSGNLGQLSVCIGKGLFPLATEGSTALMFQWMNYIQELNKPANYPNSELPEPEELARRDSILKKAFSGISETVLAVYVVPEEYTLGEICEIFETLNTTGTKVSTVDLLHSWLYNDTNADEEPILLREWIDELGQLEGAVGWASRGNRPEIVAQLVTACYLALDSEKPAPRSVGSKKKRTSVTSMKAGDLLATPSEFWKEAVSNGASIAQYIGDFQKCVSGSYFPLLDCPYPVTVAIYSALRWYMDNDSRYADQWSVEELDALFRAFFWRNSLTGRYDQGFLSQSATDIKALKEILFRRSKAETVNAWAIDANRSLDKMMQPLPSTEDLKNQFLAAKPAGALGRALTLVIRARPSQDLLDPGVSLSYPSTRSVELHHIYPQAWCANNQHGLLAEILDPNRAEFDYVRSVSNLTPLTRESNNDWRAKTPGQALKEKSVTYEVAQSRLTDHFVSRKSYASLTASNPDPLGFWTSRASDIAEYVAARCIVNL